jgi:choline dehydrogenase-like flavoprotein
MKTTDGANSSKNQAGAETAEKTFDVVVVGAGIGGISAGVSAARQGCRTLLIERMAEVGGTGVHSPVALICPYWDRSLRIINDGLHREFFPQIVPVTGHCLSYDERELAENYRRAIEGERLLTVWTSTEVRGARVRNRILETVTVTGRHEAVVRGTVWVDGSADGNLAALTGCAYEKGRKGDGRMQPATLTFSVDGIDHARLPPGGIRHGPGLWALWRELQPYFEDLKASGKTLNPREDVLCFPYPDNRRLLFNQTRILGVDPTDPESVRRAYEEGRRQVNEFFECLRRHPAFHSAWIESISPVLGVREGRRIVGDHVLTEEECLAEARFDDMVAACSSSIDIHSPDGSGTRKVFIPGSGYFHIPYRCLIARDLDNLLLGSRCISGTHEAHSAYRVMSVICCVGQAAGIAAALAAHHAEGRVRRVDSAWIRHELIRAGAFAEGPVAPPPDLNGNDPPPEPQAFRAR